MIEIIPAIDLINGQCVRLTQGMFDKKKIYSSNPVKIAQEFEAHGIKRLHLVDLDGAQKGNPQNQEVLRDICKQTNLVVDYGGGIRTKDQVANAFKSGTEYIVIGSLAVKDPKTTKSIIEAFGPKRFIIAADINNDKVYINGWQQASQITINELISIYSDLGINQYICTDISRDGMLTGANSELYTKLKLNFPNKYIIASGGVKSEDDITNLNDLDIDAIVIGKAFYEGIIDLSILKKLLC